MGFVKDQANEMENTDFRGLSASWIERMLSVSAL
jgi:hypothetical protein